MSGPARSQSVAAKIEAVRESLLHHVDSGDRLAIVEAPPGSGKTFLLLEAAKRALKRGLRIAIATQTNTQADDICRRLAAEDVPCVRFASRTHPPVHLGTSVSWEVDTGQLPVSKCIVVGTSAKWGLVGNLPAFDFVFVEEAWQLAWGDFMLLGQVAERFVLIGDPGQVPPVVSTDASRWETAPRPPHQAAPEVILEDENITGLKLSLPATRRLPPDSADLIRSFYSFEFEALARPGDRLVEAGRHSTDAKDKAIDLLRTGSTVAYTLPTPGEGPPLECDEEIARAAVSLAKRLLEREARCVIDGERKKLRPEDIGLCATHRVMNGAMEKRLTGTLKGIRVDTPERWQGLECKILIMVHPLSGVVTPSGFDLETGRLCVMASRHKAGLIVVSRDHLSATLDDFLPRAEQAVGRPDVAGRGHARNLAFWTSIKDADRVVPGR